MNFRASLEFVLAREGGFVDHPNDPGGATNYGITQFTFDTWSRANGRATQSVRNIDRATVAELYLDRYWTPAGCDKLDPRLALVVFDSAVLFGVKRAVAWLQSALSEVGGEIDVDGSFGPKTAQAAAEQSHDVGGLCALIVLFRRNRHRQRARAHAPSRVFLRGWLARTDLLLQKITPHG